MPSIASNKVLVEMVSLPSGEFLMGSNNQLFSEAPAHPVMIQSDFLLGKYPITQAQWLSVMGDNPSTFQHSPDHPVDSVSWEQATDFCHRLSHESNCNVRLPSEAEWEYACRAGTQGEYFFGSWGPFFDDSDVPWDARQTLSEYAWYDLNSGDSTQPVGLKNENPWGLHDMVGNVWEWCADVWHDNYIDAPFDGICWISGEDRQPGLTHKWWARG